MGKEILKCGSCGVYTLKTVHCDYETKSIKPAKYSPEDKWQRYRLRYKKQILDKRGSQKLATATSQRQAACSPFGLGSLASASWSAIVDKPLITDYWKSMVL